MIVGRKTEVKLSSTSDTGREQIRRSRNANRKVGAGGSDQVFDVDNEPDSSFVEALTYESPTPGALQNIRRDFGSVSLLYSNEPRFRVPLMDAIPRPC